MLVACLARRLVRLRAGFRPPGSPVLRAASSALKRAGVALEFLDNLGIIHTPKGWLLLRQLLDELHGGLVLVHAPALRSGGQPY